MIIDDVIEFVKSQKIYQERLCDRFEANKSNQDWKTLKAQSFREKRIIPGYAAVIETLEEFKALKNSPPAPQNIKNLDVDMDDESIDPTLPLFGRFGDISDLPPELIEELKISDSDELSMQIIEIMRESAQEMNTDQIMISLYRKFKRIEKRDALGRKLYRMTKANEIISVPKRKGIYALPDASSSQAA